VIYAFGDTGITLTFGDNAAFEGNTSLDTGAIYVGSTSGATLLTFGNNAAFQNNTCTNGRGGAIYAYSYNGAALTFGDHAVFKNNTTGGGYGGAVHIAAYYGTASLELRGNTLFDGNKTGQNGGAVYMGGTVAAGDVRFLADSGDIVFQNNLKNWNGTTGNNNAAYFDIQSGTVSLAANSGKAVRFYDPLESNSAYRFNIDINNAAGVDNNGTVLFDGYQSDIYADTAVYSGTMQLQNHAVYGASGNTGFFRMNNGSTLSVRGTGNGINAGTFNFQPGSNLQFWVDAGAPNKNDPSRPMLTVNNNADFTQSLIDAGVLGPGDPLSTGDRILLVDAGNNTVTLPGNTATGGMGGLTLNYKFGFELSDTDTRLWAVLLAKSANDGAKSLLESRLGTLALLDQTQSSLADWLMRNEVLCPVKKGLKKGWSGWTPFAYFTGGGSRYQTGSHVDIDDFGLNPGVTKSFCEPSGSWLFGGMFQAAWSSYKTFNEPGFRASGNGSLYGAAVFVKRSWRSGLYADSAVYVGSARTSYFSNDFNNGSAAVEYALNTPYAGWHAGLGKIKNWTPSLRTDGYIRYYGMFGTSGDAAIPDPVKFDSLASHRLRAGGRLQKTLGTFWSGYLGAAWEHEFSGNANGTTYGLAIDSPTLRGGTGIGELGLRFEKLSENRAGWTLDTGLQGYTGKRQGIAGNLAAAYRF
jgi:predicted outer membrane repeat protein